MPVIKDEIFVQKALARKKALRHSKAFPQKIIKIEKDSSSFQGLRAVPTADMAFPMILDRGDSLILDFGDHHVGYLHFSIEHLQDRRITDSPVQCRFTFGEFPLEITTPPESYSGTLGRGWLQNETKSVVFTPYSGMLERRYSFRYLKIERMDNASFPIAFTDIYADCVSAVDTAAVKGPLLSDPVLKKIYEMSLKTLKECEQDVFEDGPKRDRRLWIGDLRLQALTDYVTFRNVDLIERCIYLFAAYRTDRGFVPPCVFPDSPPCIDNWYFVDYSLFFISCLSDYAAYCDNPGLLNELYPVAAEQIRNVSAAFDSQTASISGSSHIDWCNGLDKSVAILGVYLYVLRQFSSLTEFLRKDAGQLQNEIRRAEKALKSYYSEKDGLFRAKSGQLSWHSQIWAVLSGMLSKEEGIRLLQATEQKNPEYTIHTPYMMHYYIAALYQCGLKEKAMEEIRRFWGAIADAGFDCCPEIFNPSNHLESPYLAPEINSACHAWSCTPAYWIHRYCSE